MNSKRVESRKGEVEGEKEERTGWKERRDEKRWEEKRRAGREREGRGISDETVLCPFNSI